jgi:putative pyruvate formate lyase activating enzyme
MKYGDAQLAHRYSKVPDYVEVNQAAVREMHRQVGDLVVSKEGLARRGLLVRHLVLPNGVAGTKEVLRFLGEQISRHTAVNLMDQYRPCFRADRYECINRPLASSEFEDALELAKRFDLQLQ